MNYLKQLKQDNDDLKMAIDNASEAITDLQRLLNSTKHNGVDSNGDRLDWIATRDVLTHCQLIRNALHS